MSRRYVLTFQPRFHELVANGTKRQTIRGLRKGPQIEPGDVLSLRAWVGLPYRSKQRLLRPECPCVASGPITIAEEGVVLIAPWVGAPADMCNLVAKADGFADYEEMLAWFREQHGLPFKGILVKW